MRAIEYGELGFLQYTLRTCDQDLRFPFIVREIGIENEGCGDPRHSAPAFEPTEGCDSVKDDLLTHGQAAPHGVSDSPVLTVIILGSVRCAQPWSDAVYSSSF